MSWKTFNTNVGGSSYDPYIGHTSRGVYLTAVGTNQLAIGDGSSTDIIFKPGYMEFSEISDPGSVNSNKGWLYLADDGSGNSTFYMETHNTGGLNVDGGIITGGDLILSSGSYQQEEANGAALNIKSIAEEVTISVGQGAGGVVTSGNLAPADSLILAVTARVTDAPGGGATTFDVGVTGSGNLDSLIDGVATALDTQGNSASDNDGTQLPIANGTATTLTVTTDSDVTTDVMKIRLVVWYLELVEPTS